MITDFSHITLNCRELERSVAFYQTLGLEVLRDVGELNAPGIAQAFQLPAGHLRVVHLAPPGRTGNMKIDLCQWLDPTPVGAPYSTLNHVGWARLCLVVQGLDETVQQLQAQGIGFLSDIAAFGQGVRSVCLHDPDGTVVQLIEGL
ncbi:VOC family protein [Hymenobacter lapidiphilus]|uniref:VOC family protein n=1 Tax=Hymenobacter lapidiphilus TaxID=2608003 RepID=A0A7Y7PQM5_9BACT|nr:VOC family protein [Hymenobacter lapidiphilus]NVO32258.1 VOC family protein [Hymenobacter lapidiphilus]